MADPKNKKPKPIVVIYEIPHKPPVQNELMKLREKFKERGWQVFVQNPGLYRSAERFQKKELQLCVVYDSNIVNAKLITKDYLEAKIDVVSYKEAVELLKSTPDIDAKEIGPDSKLGEMQSFAEKNQIDLKGAKSRKDAWAIIEEWIKNPPPPHDPDGEGDNGGGE